ncbi:hypothetical protein M3Y99_00057300 [Aphelenchoides fujianensis]|nr:hypothetical protein M3Y99_00057300 [Aphelenchoides fujianensis]
MVVGRVGVFAKRRQSVAHHALQNRTAAARKRGTASLDAAQRSKLAQQPRRKSTIRVPPSENDTPTETDVRAENESGLHTPSTQTDVVVDIPAGEWPPQ